MPKFALTVKQIESLPIPAKGRVDYQDSTLPGLVLRVRHTGAKSYSVSWRKDGARPRVTLGITKCSPKRGPGVHVERLSLAEARDRAREVLKDARVGIDPAAERREQKSAKTFAQLAREYVERHAKRKKTAKGAREDQLRIEKKLIPRWGFLKAGEVQKRDVVALLDEYEDAGKFYARNRMQALVSRIFSFGLDRDEIGLESNPARKLVDTELESARKRVLSDDELKVVIPLLRDEGLAGLGFQLLLLTGQRPNEVFGMHWSEIDGDTWSLPKERTKNRRSKNAPDFHVIPLSIQARAILNELRAHENGTGFVFPSPRHGKALLNYQKAARRVKTAANLSEDWIIYDLKTACLTGLESLGVPGPVVSAVANHLPTTITRQHYAFHGFADEKREALAKWGDHVEKIDPTTTAKVVKIRRKA